MKCGILTSPLLLLLLLLLSCTTGVMSNSDEPEDQHNDMYEDEVDAHGFYDGQYYEENDGSMSLARAKVPSTADCIKPCKKTEDCYCEVLSGKGKKGVPKYVTRNCSEGFCNYCSEYRTRCSFGHNPDVPTIAPPKYGYIPCCDFEGSSFQNKNLKGRNIDCVYNNRKDIRYYQCLEPCQLARTMACEDKDGWLTVGHVSCQGEGKHTFVSCIGRKLTEHPVECGATGASCNKVPCCGKFFKCVSGTCVRDCVEPGVTPDHCDNCCARGKACFGNKCQKW